MRETEDRGHKRRPWADPGFWLQVAVAVLGLAGTIVTLTVFVTRLDASSASTVAAVASVATDVKEVKTLMSSLSGDVGKLQQHTSDKDQEFQSFKQKLEEDIRVINTWIQQHGDRLSKLEAHEANRRNQ